jgi:hypothetical protein
MDWEGYGKGGGIPEMGWDFPGIGVTSLFCPYVGCSDMSLHQMQDENNQFCKLMIWKCHYHETKHKAHVGPSWFWVP